MRYISTFSGIEAASVAWEPLGWEPVAFSEVDEFPSAVLAERFPHVPNLGDITKVDWSSYHGAVDLVVGGSPCQSFSIAGNRTGLEGASGLMWEYVRCVREVRPRWIVWENVPGALSSSKGEDFRCLLASLDELGYGLAWRVLDAQFFGVAQRRRRVFLVGSLGDRRSADVLLEPDCLRWDAPSSRDKRKELAGGIEGGAGKRRSAGFSAGQSQKAGSLAYQEEVAPTLRAGESGTNQVPTIITPKTMLVRCGCAGGGKGALIQDDVSATLATSNTQTLFQPICMMEDHGKAEADVGVTGALTAHDSKSDPLIVRAFAQNTRNELRFIGGDGSVSGALSASPGMKQTSYAMVDDGKAYMVRRLTPRECERLQGFPDGHTDLAGADPDELFERIARDGMDDSERKALLRNLRKWCKATPDGKRYKALGNSMAVPVMRWIGERIEIAMELERIGAE